MIPYTTGWVFILKKLSRYAPWRSPGPGSRVSWASSRWVSMSTSHQTCLIPADMNTDIDQQIARVCERRTHAQKYTRLAADIAVWKKEYPDYTGPLTKHPKCRPVYARFGALRRAVNAAGVRDFDAAHPGIIKEITRSLGDRWWVVSVKPTMEGLDAQQIVHLFRVWRDSDPSHQHRVFPLPGECVDSVGIGMWLFDMCNNRGRYRERLDIFREICGILGFDTETFRERVCTSHRNLFPSHPDILSMYRQWKATVECRPYPRFRETVYMDGRECGIGYHLNQTIRNYMATHRETDRVILGSIGTVLGFDDPDWWTGVPVYDMRNLRSYRNGPCNVP